jgi:hypothetical protein
MKQKIAIRSVQQKDWAIDVIRSMPYEPTYEIIIQERKSTRSLEQNAKMWAALSDIADQVEWYGQKLTKEEWKCVLSAAIKKQKAVPGIDGGFVIIGAHTSKMSVSEMSDLLELATAFGTQHNVRWKA